MSRIIRIEVNLDDEDADEQLMNGAATLAAAAGNEAELRTAAVTVPAGTKEVDVSDMAPPKPKETAPPPPAEVELDEEGLPWDGRIHAPSKKKLVKGGTWKLKRNLDPAFVEEVKVELRATMGAAPATTETSAAEAFGETEVPELPDAPMTFPEVMQIITERMAPGAESPLAQADLDAILAGIDIPSLPMLASRPDLIPAVVAELEAI